MGAAGTGALYLARDRKWMRPLLRVVRASDRGHVSPYVVADHLARLNYEVHRHIPDKSVGPSCIVAWRHRKGGVHKGGGASQFYIGAARDARSSGLPIIGCGQDLRALFDFLTPRVMKQFEAMRTGQPPLELDTDEMNAELARLPDKPDEDLR
jgi:hypothetical protein